MKETHATESKIGSSYLDDRPRINLDFVDLYYPAQSGPKIGGRKHILQGVSGSFKHGNLSVILGSSGAGKSTLLNILTGYASVGVSGSIKINGTPSYMDVFRKLSTYIMQEDLLQEFLTVQESMFVVAHLKLGRCFSTEEKTEVINRIIDNLGLAAQRHTRTEKLSGGQKKRVSIALELVSNPPVIFLDEPTTGLDVVSTTNVIKLLKKLARQGRTVVCILHQPSAALCKYFDHLYVMSRGHCVYQGCYKALVPFLSNIGYECPVTYNPTDYIIETVQGKTKEEISLMSQAVENGKLCVEALKHESEYPGFEKVNGFVEKEEPFAVNLYHPAGFYDQFLVLIKRRFKQQYRNLLTLCIFFCHHVIVGFLLGSVFHGVGNDATRPFENFKFFVCVVVFFMYTYSLAPVLLFPLEVKLMKREYFNRWYGLKAYFASLSIASIPPQILFGTLFIFISYFISNQPMEISRLFLFTLIGLLLGYVSEGWGITVGSLFSSRNGSIVGPGCLVPLLALSVYGMGYGTAVEPFMQFLMNLSYLRYGVVGLTSSIYGRNRTLECDIDKNTYCHYKDPVLLMKDLGMEGTTVYTQIGALWTFLIIHRAFAYLGLKYRLNIEFSNMLLNFMRKLFRHRHRNNR